MAVVRFEGGFLGSKGGGIQSLFRVAHFSTITDFIHVYQAGEIVLSTNDETPRDARTNTGRVYLFLKQFTGYVEPDNMLEALLEQSLLHKARQSDEQVRKNEMTLL